jgi:hypothetical protein
MALYVRLTLCGGWQEDPQITMKLKMIAGDTPDIQEAGLRLFHIYGAGMHPNYRSLATTAARDTGFELRTLETNFRTFERESRFGAWSLEYKLLVAKIKCRDIMKVIGTSILTSGSIQSTHASQY